MDPVLVEINEAQGVSYVYNENRIALAVSLPDATTYGAVFTVLDGKLVKLAETVFPDEELS
jgi:hypothetical protein